NGGGPAAEVQIAAWSSTRRAWGLWGRSGPPQSPEGAEQPWGRDAEQGWAEGAGKGSEQGAGVDLTGHLGQTDTLGVCLSQRTLSLPSLATAPEAEALRLARHPSVLTLVEGRRGEAAENSKTSSALQRSLSSPSPPEQGGRGVSGGSAAPSKPSSGKRSSPGFKPASKPGSKPKTTAKKSSHPAPPPKAPLAGALDSSKQVVLHEQLGSGAFGTVYRGEWRGRAVAVKVLQTAGASSHSKELDSFRREVEVLSRLKHPHIISFLAASTVPPTICIVEELAAGGSLYARLHGQSGAHRARPLPYSTLLGVALGVAEAMEYLHPHVVHRDLKSQNVLLDEGGRALVCDFGIAKFKDRTFLSTANGQAGTPAYMAPEMFDGAGISEKVDVFSFAVLLWEMLTGQVPWAHVPSPMQIIYYVGVMGQRLPLPDSCPRGLRDLIVRCWADEPEARPRFASIVPWLRAETVRVQRRAGGAGKGLGPQTLQALQGQPSYALSEEEEEEEEFGSKASPSRLRGDSPSKVDSQAQPTTGKGSSLARSPRRGHASPPAALAQARSSGSASPSSPPPPDRPLSPGLHGSLGARRGSLGVPPGTSAPFAPGPLSAAHAKRVLAEGERTEPEPLAAPRTALSVLIASSLPRPDPGEGSGVPCSPLQSALLSPASPRTGV
ncbi:protein tyrosine kinase, partial [Helicosporidium sp. ATCC 50920]